MPNEKVTCPSCGGVHDDWPFSKELLAIWRKIDMAEDEQDRAKLMFALAEQFIEDISDTDEAIGEELHLLMSRVIESRMSFERHSLRLARTLMRSIPKTVHDEDPEQPSAPVKQRAN